MKYLKNFIVGFLVSFVGSIPLGYLNFIGFEIYNKSNLTQLVYYLFGVVIIEGIVIYLTLYFANKLNLNPKIKKFITIFSIFFLLALAYYFSGKGTNNYVNTNYFLIYPAFVTGIVLSFLNFAQIPFWFSWNLYLLNQNYISSNIKETITYILGTLLGTFSGMLVLIFGLKKATITGIINPNFVSNKIWVLFLGLALFQVYQLYKQSKNTKTDLKDNI